MFYNFFDPKRKKQGSKNFPLWTVLRETLVKNEAGNDQLVTGLRKTPFPRCLLAFRTSHQNAKFQKISSLIRVFLLFSQLPQKTPFKCTPLLQQFLWRFKAVRIVLKKPGRVLCMKRSLQMSSISPLTFNERTFIHAETGNGGSKLSNCANGQIRFCKFSKKVVVET